MAQRRAVTNSQPIVRRVARRTRRSPPAASPPAAVHPGSEPFSGSSVTAAKYTQGSRVERPEIVDQRVELTVLASHHDPSTERSTTATTRRFSVRQRITPPGGCDVRQQGPARQSAVPLPTPDASHAGAASPGSSLGEAVPRHLPAPWGTTRCRAGRPSGPRRAPALLARPRAPAPGPGPVRGGARVRRGPPLARASDGVRRVGELALVTVRQFRYSP